MMSRLIFFLNLFILLISVNSYSNDTYLGSVSGNPFPAPNYFQPSKAKNIQMIKERIYVKLLPDSCTVNCKFWFYNSGETDTVSVGFPDYMVTESDNSDSLRNFNCFINGTPQHHSFSKYITIESNREKRTNDDHLEDFYWFTWPTTFKGKDTTYIENNFTANWGGLVMCTRMFCYFIGSGATWDGPIKDGKIVFDHSNFLSDKFRLKDNYLKHECNLFEDSVVVNFRNYTPERMERVCITFLYDTLCSGRYNNISKENLRLMRNELFARHGYIFKDKILNSYFYKKHWYKPDKNFKITGLSEHENGLIKVIERAERTGEGQ